MRPRFILLFAALAFTFSACGGPARQVDWAALEADYSRAQAFFESEEIDSSLVYLDRCLKLDRKYAPAHHLLGQIYLLKDGIYNRRLSALSLREAIKAQENNPEYHYSLGLTLEKQGFAQNALEEYKAAARLDTSDVRPLMKIADINQKIGLRYDDDRYFKRAFEASSRAAVISQDPAQYYRQAVALYQMGPYDSSAGVLRQAISMTDSAGILSKCWLLLGAELAIERKFDSAQAAFNAGRNLISKMARDEMDDVRFLMPAKEYAAFRNESFSAQEGMAEKLWGRLDPDPTTALNERKLEHYARFIHAQLTFSIPERNIDGWKTKRGELYIRYGPPTETTFLLGEGDRGASRWVWTYGQFKDPAIFTFEDTFLNGEFDFPFPNKNWTADDYARDPARLADMLGSSDPESFEYSPGSGPLKYSFMPRQFKGTGGKTDLEVFVAIPYTELSFRREGDYAYATVDWRQVLRYPGWALADSAREIRTYRARASQTENATLTMSDRLMLSEYPDSLIFAIAIRDTISGHVGIATRELRLKNFQSGKPEVSDIVLARRIDRPPGALDFRRRELGIFSNLENEYFAGEPVLLYFELYNLSRNADGKTSYSLRQIMSRKRPRGLLGTVKGVLGKDDFEEVVTTYEGGSVKTDENRILSLDVSQFEAGKYTLTIEIEDLVSGQTARSSQDIVLYR